MPETSRRAFVGVTGAALLAACAPAAVTRRDAHDLIIRGGTVLDGSGAAGVTADVAVSGGRIAAIGPSLAARGAEELDARHLAVVPGFIDIHSHADGSLDDDPRSESAIRQGITTIIAGQDGGSRGTGAGGLGAWFKEIDALQPGPNVASMVGLGSVRGAVVGNDDRPATPAELAEMTRLVEAALADGACGASSGLEYTPGAFASIEELIALCRPLAARRLPYASHMRNEDDRLLAAIDEAIAVARGAGCPLHVSHLKTQGPRNWPRLDDAFARIEGANSGGGSATFDRYAYIAYSTGLTNLFPVWSRDGGTDDFLARLDAPETSDRIRTEALAKVELIGGWHNVQISSVRNDADRAAEGQRLDDWARMRNEEPYAATLGLLRRNRGGVGMLGFAMSEENLDRILAHPLAMVCTDGGGFAIDGPTRRGSPHPRGAGSFARVLGRYVRERKALTLPDAIRKMTSAPAARLRLADRGLLRQGYAADVVIFDPDTVADRATFENPFQYPVGISAVIVNGRFALRDGTRTMPGSGRSLRPAANPL
ncbi:MAG TPA: D-aminoacylase [Gemmatimonadales bacterium]|nr:D-aminoacylase [Gemmatimonadales bacterium]